MIKRAVQTIVLVGFLCASGYGQAARIVTRVGSREKQVRNCVTARSIVSELQARSRDGLPFLRTPVKQLPDSQAFFFISGMTIDADGAPNAYHPDDIGLDELANAGRPGHWNGIITDRDGGPLIQHKSDPFPGYYISCTSLFDKTKKFTDPTRYVDASTIPYVALPKDLADREGVQLGDFAFVVNLRNGKSSFAIYADIGSLGEGSIALADALEIWSDARRGGESDGILYLLIPGSGNEQPRAAFEIRDKGEEVLFGLQEMKRLSSLSCAEKEALASQTGAF